MISIWEQQSLLNKDIVVIGSGITGLSAAAWLKDNHPDRQVTVVEQGLLPSGASTKNAGFACFGSLSEIIDDLFSLSEEEVKELVAMRLRGLRILVERLGAENIDFQQNGGYELIREEDLHYLEKLEYINDMLFPIFDGRCFEMADDKIKKFGFSERNTAAMVYTSFEGQIDTGRMMNALLQHVRNRGVEIITNTRVTSLADNGSMVELSLNDQYKVNADKVLVATNGFASQLMPEVAVKPGRGLVLATKPIRDLSFKGTFHMDRGYYYFRNFHNRIILGGGRNLDLAGETTTAHEVNQQILEKLKEILSETIMQGRSHDIDIMWTGIMGFGPDKKVTISKCSENVIAGVGLGGMGVAIGSIIGEQLAISAME